MLISNNQAWVNQTKHNFHQAQAIQIERNAYHIIEVKKNSMKGFFEPKDWVICEEIPLKFWEEKETFNPNKVYCLFHRKYGVLFKRISKVHHGVITLSSNKIDSLDEDFDLMNFSKILIVRKVERNV